MARSSASGSKYKKMWSYYVTVLKCWKLKRIGHSKKFKIPRARPNKYLISKTLMTTSMPSRCMRNECTMRIWGWARLRTTKSIRNRCRVWEIRVTRLRSRSIKRLARLSAWWVSRGSWRHASTMKALSSGESTSRSWRRTGRTASRRWTTSSSWSKRSLAWTNLGSLMMSNSR